MSCSGRRKWRKRREKNDISRGTRQKSAGFFPQRKNVRKFPGNPLTVREKVIILLKENKHEMKLAGKQTGSRRRSKTLRYLFPGGEEMELSMDRSSGEAPLWGAEGESAAGRGLRTVLSGSPGMNLSGKRTEKNGRTGSLPSASLRGRGGESMPDRSLPMAAVF